jgi:hypothetical protein
MDIQLYERCRNVATSSVPFASIFVNKQKKKWKGTRTEEKLSIPVNPNQMTLYCLCIVEPRYYERNMACNKPDITLWKGMRNI